MGMPNLIWLSACGGNKVGKTEGTGFVGLIETYKPPISEHTVVEEADPYFKELEPSYSEPYWNLALEMSQGGEVVNTILDRYENIINFSYPLLSDEIPTGYPSTWLPANERIKGASREIFDELNKVLEVKFIETEFNVEKNLVSIVRSIQSDTAGFSYFPNYSYEIGSDVFISTAYDFPEFISDQFTNYDYEVLLHEIGHALGLKHPFEADRNNTTTLDEVEDNTGLTAMSYNDKLDTFSGEFRPLDLLVLTKFYGVNKSFNAGDDTYYFSPDSATLIIDGDGNDSIDAVNTQNAVFIDLRPGTHSYSGHRKSHITDSNQMTISHGSNIENIYSGPGNDWIIGNSLDNFISTNSGNDKIYLGEGMDVVVSGAGSDLIDLSELEQQRDTIVVEYFDSKNDVDTVYGFRQGLNGDCIDLGAIINNPVDLLPLILLDSVPLGYLKNHILRISGDGLTSSEELVGHFSQEGSLVNLNLPIGNPVIVLSSESNETGYEQCLFTVERLENEIMATKLMVFDGNYLDIDLWVPENFIS